MNSSQSKEENSDVFQTKTKRDQYLFEIRKKKAEDIINAKRVKLTTHLTPSSSNPEGNHQNLGSIANNKPSGLPENASLGFQELTSEFFKGLSNNDLNAVFTIILALRHKISNSSTPPLDDFFATGIFPHLVKFLEPEYKNFADLQYEVLWVILNSFTGTEQQTAKIISKPLVQTIMKYMWHTKQEIVEQAFWALGNISGDNDTVRTMLIELDLIEEINKFTKTNNHFSENLIKCISWILSNLALLVTAHEKLTPLFPLMQQLIKQNEPEICTYACWTFSHLTSQNDKLIEALINDSVVKRLVELLDSKDINIKRPALRIVGNVLSGKSHHTIKMYEAGCLPKLEALMEHRKPLIRREAIWAISNLLAENSQIIGEVLQTALFARLLNSIIMDIVDVKCESFVCFINALNVATIKQADSIVRMGLIRVLPQCLAHQNVKVVMITLECIDGILKCGKTLQDEENSNVNPYLLSLQSEGVIRYIEDLQTHPSDDVYKKVSEIIDNYFETEKV